MKVLVTGGLGYLGGRICKYLASRNFELLIGTRNAAGAERPPWLEKGRFVNFDLRNLKAETFDSLERVDAIVHLAALNEIDCAADPLAAIEVNTLATKKLIDLSNGHSARFIYFSTAHVYGSPLQGRLHEELITRPVHPYAYTHRFSEDLVLASVGREIKDAAVLRLSNGFGAPDRPDVNRWTLLVNDLCEQLVNTGAMKLKGDGSSLRDFITLHDVAAATEHFLRLAGFDSYPVYNVGSGVSQSVWQMAILVGQEYASMMGQSNPPAIHREIQKMDGAIELTPMHFEIHKLSKSGFRLSGDVGQEIRDTLHVSVLRKEKQNKRAKV